MVYFPFDFREDPAPSDEEASSSGTNTVTKSVSTKLSVPSGDDQDKFSTEQQKDDQSVLEPSIEVPFQANFEVGQFPTAPLPSSGAYDMRMLKSTELAPTEVQSSDSSSDTWDVGRVYEKSSRRTRRAKRRRLYLWLALVGILIMVIAFLIGVVSRLQKKSSSSSAAGVSQDPPSVGESPSMPPVMAPSGTSNPADDILVPVATPTAIVTTPVATPVTVPTVAPIATPVTAPTATPVAAPVTAPTQAPVAAPTRRVAPPVVVNNPEDFLIPSLEFPQGVVLAPDRFLGRGDFVASPNGEFQVGLDPSTGELILEDRLFNVIWSCGVRGGDRVFMQSDGNLIVRDSNRKAIWNSATSGNDGAALVVDDGGRIAVMLGTTALWFHGIPRNTYTGPSSTDLTFPTRGIFYYPWFPETWTLNGQPVKFPPTTGLYSSSDPNTARKHIDAMDYANIDLSIASWWGPNTNLDRARISLLMDQTLEMGSDLKWSVYHEDEREQRPSVESLRSDLDYLKKWFAWHPTWAHKDGKPVIFVFNSDGCDVVDRWMEASNNEWYVVLKIFPKFKNCSRQPDHWHQYGVDDGTPLQYDGYSVSIAPGFWRADADAPKTPRVTESQWCQNVQLMASSDEPWHLIISFNEAGEGTNIENSPSWSSNTDYGYYLDCLHQYPTIQSP